MEKEPITKAKDFSCEIDTELNQLIALGDLLGQLKPDCEFLDKTLEYLGHTIIGIGRRIEKMTDPTYKASYEQGKRAAAQGGK